MFVISFYSFVSCLVPLFILHSFNENFESNNVHHLTMNKTGTFHNMKEIEINSEKEGKKTQHFRLVLCDRQREEATHSQQRS